MALLARCCPPPYRALAPLLYRDVVIPLPTAVWQGIFKYRHEVRLAICCKFVCYCCATVPILTGDGSLELQLQRTVVRTAAGVAFGGIAGTLLMRTCLPHHPPILLIPSCVFWGLHRILARELSFYAPELAH